MSKTSNPAHLRKAAWLMMAAGAVFVLGALVILLITLVRGAEFPPTVVAFFAVGTMFFALGAALAAQARKGDPAADRQSDGPSA